MYLSAYWACIISKQNSYSLFVLIPYLNTIRQFWSPIISPKYIVFSVILAYWIWNGLLILFLKKKKSFHLEYYNSFGVYNSIKKITHIMNRKKTICRGNEHLLHVSVSMYLSGWIRLDAHHDSNTQIGHVSSCRRLDGREQCFGNAHDIFVRITAIRNIIFIVKAKLRYA